MDEVLERAVDRWRAAELLDGETSAAIRSFEESRAGGDVGARSRDVVPSGRAGFVAEGLAYLGAALAIGAAFALFGPLWQDLGGLARTLVAAFGTLALAGAAVSLGGVDSDAVHRLRSLLAALAVGGVALTIGIAAGEFTGLDEDAVALLAGVGALAAGVPVHLMRPSWPTTLVTGAALLTTLVSGESVLGLLDDELAAGITFVGVGLAWAALGWAGVMRPRSAFEVTGLLTGGVGVQVLAFESFPVGAPVIGLVVAGGVLAIGMLEERTPPAVLGGLGITVFAPQLVFELFGETIGGPLALFVGGIALVTVAVVVLRQRGVA